MPFPAGSMLMAAEVVSSLKRTLSRMLVIIVSLGFGIVKWVAGGDFGGNLEHKNGGLFGFVYSASGRAEEGWKI